MIADKTKLNEQSLERTLNMCACVCVCVYIYIYIYIYTSNVMTELKVEAH